MTKNESGIKKQKYSVCRRIFCAALAALFLFGTASCANTDKTDRSSDAGPAETEDVTFTESAAVTAQTETAAAQTAVPETTTAVAQTAVTAPATTAAQPVSAAVQTPAVPVTKAEIVAFFAAAVNDVKNNGSAAYDKVEYQKIHEVNMTGNAAVDRMISESIGCFAKDETTAEHVRPEKGTPACGENMLGWGLTDDSAVVSATLTETGDLYRIAIVMADEDTPNKTAPKHLEAVGSVMYPEDIEAALGSVPQMNEFGDIRILYTGYTITADVTPDNKLVGLRHQTNVEIILGHMKVMFFSLDNKSITLENVVEYSGFVY